MNIRQHLLKSILSGLPARFDVQGAVSGVLFEDEQEFIPLSDLGYSSEIGYYRLSRFPAAANECDNSNPETIRLLADSDGDGQTPLYVWMDADGEPHMLGELHQAADLYSALGALLHDGRTTGEPISEHDPAWGQNYDIRQAVEEAIVYGYGSDRERLADSIRAAARAGRIRGATNVDGRWSIPPLTLRGWLVRSREEKRGRPRREVTG